MYEDGELWGVWQDDNPRVRGAFWNGRKIFMDKLTMTWSSADNKKQKFEIQVNSAFEVDLLSKAGVSHKIKFLNANKIVIYRQTDKKNWKLTKIK